MNETTEKQLLQDVGEIKTAFTGTIEKPGLTHVLAEISKTLNQHGEDIKKTKDDVAILNNERQQRIAIDRWIWVKIVGIASAIPFIIELAKWLTNKTNPPAP